MKVSLIVAVAGLILCQSALAQDPNARLMAANQSIEDDALQIANGVCRGPQIDNSLAGMPGDELDDIRCASISMASLGCLRLAQMASSDLSQVQNGSATFDQIEHSLDDSTGSDVADATSAFILAQQAPQGTDPAQFIETIFISCTGLIKTKE